MGQGGQDVGRQAGLAGLFAGARPGGRARILAVQRHRLWLAHQHQRQHDRQGLTFDVNAGFFDILSNSGSIAAFEGYLKAKKGKVARFQGSCRWLASLPNLFGFDPSPRAIWICRCDSRHRCRASIAVSGDCE
jgi:hypothetical protein